MSAEFDLKRLRHFVLLAEERNFTRAAERASLSQTAFSRSIQGLEERFGVRIFDRGTRSVRITAAGEQLVLKARGLLAQARDLARDVDGIANATGGELSFGTSLMAVDSVIRGLLPQLIRQYPKLRLNVEVNHWRRLRQHLEQERIEFFVSYPGSLAHDADFAVTPLTAIPSSIFCRAGHPLAAEGVQPSPQDLPCFPWATVQLRDSSSDRLRSIFGMPAQAELPLALTCDSPSLLREAVLASDLLLISWSSWLQVDIANGLMIDLGQRLRPSLPATSQTIECAIVQLQGRTASPAARRVIQMIVDGVDLSESVRD